MLNVEMFNFIGDFIALISWAKEKSGAVNSHERRAVAAKIR